MHKSYKLLVLFTLIACTLYAQDYPKHYYVEIATENGKGVIKLYNETPQHRDNFVQLVKKGYYDSLFFHRVINHFMIQGGDPGSKYAVSNQRVGTGGPDYTIPAEIQPELIHKKGTLGAARDNNPEKRSSGSQFYLSLGKVFSEAGLDSLETLRLKKKLSPQQRQAYTTVGGVPHLDGDYTVFGEMISGLSLIDTIAAVKTDPYDRPLQDVRMHMRVLPRREALEAEYGANWIEPKRSIFKRLFGKKLKDEYTITDDENK